MSLSVPVDPDYQTLAQYERQLELSDDATGALPERYRSVLHQQSRISNQKAADTMSGIEHMMQMNRARHGQEDDHRGGYPTTVPAPNPDSQPDDGATEAATSPPKRKRKHKHKHKHSHKRKKHKTRRERIAEPFSDVSDSEIRNAFNVEMSTPLPAPVPEAEPMGWEHTDVEETLDAIFDHLDDTLMGLDSDDERPVLERIAAHTGGWAGAPCYASLALAAEDTSKERSRKTKPVFTTYLDADYTKETAAATRDGDARLDRVLWYLSLIDQKYYRRSKMQRRVNHAQIVACLPIIVGAEEFSVNKIHFLNRMNVKAHTYDAWVRAPRRFGKSQSQAMFIAAVLLAIPKITMAIFSPGDRQSGMLLHMAKGIINAIGMSDRIQRSTLNKLEVTPEDHDKNNASHCFSFPGTVALLGSMATWYVGPGDRSTDAAVLDPLYDMPRTGDPFEYLCMHCYSMEAAICVARAMHFKEGADPDRSTDIMAYLKQVLSSTGAECRRLGGAEALAERGFTVNEVTWRRTRDETIKLIVEGRRLVDGEFRRVLRDVYEQKIVLVHRDPDAQHWGEAENVLGKQFTVVSGY